MVIRLGDIASADAATAVREQFGPVDLAWLDRGELRRAPLATAARLLSHPVNAAVLVAPDLRQPRLRLTSVLLGLVRARTRWRMDLRGNRQRWSLSGHLRANAWPILRHLAACGLALFLAEPLLWLIEQAITAPTRSAPTRAGPQHAAPPGRRPQPQRGTLLGANPPSGGSGTLSGGGPRSGSGTLLGADPPSEGGGGPFGSGAPARVLYLRSQLWLGLTGGGSVAHTAGVISGLEQLGVQVDVVSSDRLPGVSARTTLVPPETWFDGWRRELEDLAYTVAYFTAALRAARRSHPQVIYQRHTAFNCAGVLLARCLRLPLALEFNSSELWKGRYWGGLRLVRAAARVERINLRAADVVVVISETLRQQVEAAGVSPEKILVNPNAVDPAQFRPDIDASAVQQRLGLDQSDVVVGFSGTFGEWHGIPSLARALPEVCQARADVRWLLVGDGPLRRLVDAAITSHGLADRVRLPGLVPYAEMPAYLAACDVLVSPHGRQADGGEFFGSPTKLFEYMAAGKPIVASAVGQIAEVLEDGRSALLVPADDPDALSAAIVRLVDDAGLRARLGQAARAAAVEHHTWRQNAERLLGALAHT